MTDRFLAALSLAGLAAYFAILIGFVPELDLTVVIVVCFLLATYDFWRELRRRRR